MTKLIILAAFILTPVAAKAIPPACASPFNTRAYTSGLATGQSLVQQAWEGTGTDCDRLGEFNAVITDNLASYLLPEAPSQYMVCRYLGHAEGILIELDVLHTICAASCCRLGYVVGDISAIAYCTISAAMGGIPAAGYFERAPATTCKWMLDACCDPRYITETYARPCTDYTDLGTSNAETGDPVWLEPWTVTRETQCNHGGE